VQRRRRNLAKHGRKKGERKQGTCVYCGKAGLITHDHVFPQVIFLELDKQMITVPACDDCQQIKSLGDRDLRTLIVMDVGGSQHPDALALVARMLDESNIRLRLWMQKTIETAAEADLVTETGIIVGKVLEFDFNKDRVMVSQGMTVRGLYYHEKGEMLPTDCPVDVEYIPWQIAPRFIQQASAVTKIELKTKGNDVAMWSSHPVPNFDDSTAWFICYNNWVLFFATTHTAAAWRRRQRESAFERANQPTDAPSTARRRIVAPRDLQGRPIIPPQ
jgi:hypothetical protein